MTLPFTVRFGSTTGFQKTVYAISLVAAATTTALVIAPVSYHRRRLHEDGEAGVPDVIRTASVLAQLGMATLLLAAVAGVLLGLDIAIGPVWAGVLTGTVTIIYVALWYVLPAVHHRRRSR